MRTYPIVDKESTFPFAFEIENAYIWPRGVAEVLREVDGVSNVRVRRAFSQWDDIHVWFDYMNREFIVFEPYGDSSRYLIGPREAELKDIDVRSIEAAFRRYRPPFLRQLVGDVLTFRLFKRMFGLQD